MSTNIALLGGGTAGHIMPNVALLPSLKENFDRVIYIGGENSMEEQICKSKNIPYYATKTMKFHRKKIWRNAGLPITLAQGIIEAVRTLKREDVDIVFPRADTPPCRRYSPPISSGSRSSVTKATNPWGSQTK